MCEPKGSMIPGPGDTVSTVVAGLSGFAASNIIPFAIAVPVDIVLGFAVAHPFLIIALTTAAAILATAGRVVVARLLLRVMGRLVVPVGYHKLRPAKARPATVTAHALPVAAAVPAIEARAPLAIDPPRTFVAGEVIDRKDEVVINGTRFPVLGKQN